MAREGQVMLAEPRPPSSNPLQDARALIEEARQRHRRRRRWTATAILAVAMVGLLVTVAVGGFNGSASKSPTSPSGAAAAPMAPPGGGLSSPSGPGLVGAGPTSIDFIDPDHGWIATGCGPCTTANPVIVRTDDGGRTWTKIRVPDMTVTTISESVDRQYGGVVNVRFVNPTNGWYLQAGELWSTNTGGATWRLAHVGGTVRDFTTSGDNAWALVDDCPASYSLNPCTHFHVYYRAHVGPTWQRLPMGLTTGSGGGAALIAYNNTALVDTRGGLFSARSNGTLVTVDPTCLPVGPLTPRQLLGICNLGGGGNASVVSFDISSDGGHNWLPLVGGPPSDAWSGAHTTNGAGVIFYITGGTTLWRIDTVDKTWASVLQAAPNTTDELFPIYFADPDHGFVFESGSSGVHMLATRDAGLTWNAVPLPPPGI